MIGTTWIGDLMKLSAVTTLPSSINKSDFFSGGMSTAEANGTAYGVPMYVETRVVYYRKDLAQKAGVTSPPATWDDLKTMAQKLKASGSKYGITFRRTTPAGVHTPDLVGRWRRDEERQVHAGQPGSDQGSRLLRQLFQGRPYP